MPRTADRLDRHDENRTLIERCVQGHRAAWDTFVDRYARLVYSVLRKSRLPADACDDVFQDVFALVLRHLPSLKDPATLPQWLITITSREAIRALRSNRPVTHDAPDAATPIPTDELEALEEHQLVRDALRELGDPCRSLLEALFSSHGSDYAVVSQKLRIPVGSIGPTRARCLARLQALLHRKSRGPGTGPVSAERGGASSD